MPKVTVIRGDCVESMRAMAPESVDAVVCDPPYGLEFMCHWDKLDWQAGGGMSKPGIGDRAIEWPSFSATSRFGAANPTCGACGGRLRGKKKCACAEPVWQPIGKRRNEENEGLPDNVTGSGMRVQLNAMQEWHMRWATEARRVLKPGGYLLAFGGTRTYHRMACAVEDAGFELRDSITWHYGCFDEETELLTPSGWVRYRDAKVESTVLCYNMRTASVEWHRVEDRSEYNYQDTAFALIGNGAEQLLSRGHRVVVERAGVLRIVRVEEIARAGQARVPVLEGLHDMLHGIPVRGSSTGSAQYDLLSGVQKHSNWCSTSGGEAEPATAEGACDCMLGVRKEFLEAGCLATTPETEGALLLQAVQRRASRGGVEAARTPWARGLDSGGASVSQGQDDGGVEPGLARRCDVFQQSRKLPANQVCKVPAGVSRNGPEGRLCDGTPAGRGAALESAAAPYRGSAPPQPQAAGQSAGKSGAVRFECGSQALRVDGITKSVMVRVELVRYTGVMWCVQVPTGAVVARRKGCVFITGNSGMPKVGFVGKQIDKALGREREIIGYDESRARPNRKYASGAIGNVGGNENTSDRTDNGATLTAPASEEAARWDGWSPTLKPASEPIVVARKPMQGTLVDNVLKHGTGAFNIKACSVGFQSGVDQASAKPQDRPTSKDKHIGAEPDAGAEESRVEFSPRDNSAGRWPSNVLLSHIAPQWVFRRPEFYACQGCNTVQRVPAAEMHTLQVVGEPPPVLHVECPACGAAQALACEPVQTGCVPVGTRMVKGDGHHPSARPPSSKVAGAAGHKGQVDLEERHAGEEEVPAYRCAPGCPVAALDAQSGATGAAAPASSPKGVGRHDHGIYQPAALGFRVDGEGSAFYGDKGGASRFFPVLNYEEADFMYCAKTARSERNAGVGQEKGNIHPTVKPIKLMRWLVKLVTPPGGVVLDPFGGSGTTGIAAHLEGFEAILCEREPQYIEIATARIQHHGADVQVVETAGVERAPGEHGPVAQASETREREAPAPVHALPVAPVAPDPAPPSTPGISPRAAAFLARMRSTP